MSTPAGDHPILRELEITVRTELVLAETSQPGEEPGGGPAGEWPDPDVERYEIALRTLLGAVEAVEDGAGQPPTEPEPGSGSESESGY
jgi:hypothetical protein